MSHAQCLMPQMISRDALVPASGIDKRWAGSILTIDLAAIKANYRLICDRVAPSECAGVVKADAYGLGARKVASALWDAGCRSFFVAHLCEAVDLRAVLNNSASIYILNGLPDGAEQDCAVAGAIPVLNSVEQVAAWSEAGKSAGRRLPAALQTDSGMSRLGLSIKDIKIIASRPATLGHIDVRLLLSHLACAELITHSKNRAQLSSFELARTFFPNTPSSLANSSGVFLDPDIRFDVVRPGAALYGINPCPNDPNAMKQVVRLSAKVIQTRALHPGDTVGYGNTFQVSDSMRIAAISLGYADGWPRGAAGGAAYLRGKRLPFVGRTSMDTITVDVSQLGAEEIRVGTPVEILNETQTIDDVAKCAGTIGHEILAGLGSRFHRQYLSA